MKHQIFVLLLAILLPFCSRTANQKKDIESNNYKINSLEKTINTSKNLIEKANAYNELGILLYNQNPDTLKSLCFSSLRVLKKVKTKNEAYYEIQSAAFNNIGYVYFLAGDYKLAKKYYKNVLQLGKKYPNLSPIISAQNNLGLLYLENGYFFDALLIYQELRKKSAADKNEKKIISSYLNNIGYIYYQLNELKVAKKYFLMGLAKNPPVNDQIAIYQNLGATFFKESNLKKAYQYHSTALNLSKKINSKFGIAKSNTSIGKIYLKQNEKAKSKYYLEKALQICTENGFIKQEADILILLSSLDENWKNIVNLEKIINRIDQLDAKLETPFIKMEIIKLKMRSSYLNKNADELYSQHAALIKIQNTILLRQQNNKIQKKEQAIQHIKRRNSYIISYQQKEFQYKIYILVCIFLIILITLLAFNILHHFKNKRLVLQTEIEKNRVKISSYNLELQAKNIVFEELHKLVELSRNNPSLLDENLNKLYSKTREQIKKESKWLEFQKLFNDIDKVFMDKLVKNYPSLTESEKRLCCLIRMNLTSQEIINILNIAKNTLKSSRFRIHKKMELSPGSRLSDFLIKL
jgi:tetratricopeptide (TPR) repeat protein